jgi:hypothetical protein
MAKKNNSKKVLATMLVVLDGEDAGEYLFGLHISDVRYLVNAQFKLMAIHEFVREIYGMRSQDMERFLLDLGLKLPEFNQWLKSGNVKKLHWFPEKVGKSIIGKVEQISLVSDETENGEYFLGLHISAVKHLVSCHSQLALIPKFARDLYSRENSEGLHLEIFRDRFYKSFPEYRFWLKRKCKSISRNSLPRKKKNHPAVILPFHQRQAECRQ